MADDSYPTIELTPEIHSHLMRYCPPALLMVSARKGVYTKEKILGEGQGIIDTRAEQDRQFAEMKTLNSKAVVFIALNIIHSALNESEEAVRDRLLELTSKINHQTFAEYHEELKCRVKYNRKRIELHSVLVTAPLTFSNDGRKRRELPLGQFVSQTPVGAAFFRVIVEKFLWVKDSRIKGKDARWRYKGRDSTKAPDEAITAKRSLTPSEFIADVVKRATSTSDVVTLSMGKRRFTLTVNRRTHTWVAVEPPSHLTAVK